MFEPTRAGKSTHLALIAMQWRRYADSRIFTFDKGLSMLVTRKGVGGSISRLPVMITSWHLLLYHDWILLPAVHGRWNGLKPF